MHKKIIRFIVSILFLLLSIFIYYMTGGNKVKANPIKKKINNKTVFVDIKGAVKSPGVYEISKDSRIIDVIKKAGDLKKEADTSIINLSKKVKDEMFIIIYTKDEIKSYKDKFSSSTEIVKEIEKKIVCPDNDNDACLKNSDTKIGKVNINNASLEELSSLTGIGEGKAKKIIEYREKNKFEKVDDIKNVSGIGDTLYEKIKDDIEV